MNTLNPSTLRPWLDLYPPGTPATTGPLQYHCLAEYTAAACARFADHTAIVQGEVVLSYRELDRLSQAFSTWLQRDAGLAAGERLAIMLPNLPQYLVALLGAWRAGLVVVNVNPQYTARELAYQLSDAGAVAVVVLDTALPLLNSVRAELPEPVASRVIVTTMAELAPQAPSAVPQHAGEVAFGATLQAADLLADVRRGPNDLALLQYTGGTTGVSKGAMLSHGNLLANLQQGQAWYGPYLEPGRESVLTVLPLYHIFGLMFNVLQMLGYGACNRLIASPRDLTAMATALQAGCTVISGVNTLYTAMLESPAFAGIDFKGLKLSVSGGASAQSSVVARWLQRTGDRIVEGYGLTETSPFALSNPLHTRHGSGLVPLPSTEVSIRDDDGNALPPNQAGEICIRGPQVMRGYWQRPEETAQVLTANGWLRTGDIGVMDPQGRFTVTDRKKDMVLVSGFNVFPNEVEEVLCQHPGVAESAVVGVPDERTGEAVLAYVVRLDPALTADMLEAHCRAALTAYKVPRQYQFVDQLPKSPVGKILRRELRTQMKKGD